MATTGRVLELLALLTTRASWQAEELAERLEVTTRTVRRDLERLRTLGYPVHSSTGPYGGYRLGAGGRLPPLVLDDDEAVAVAIALRHATTGTGTGMEEATLMALNKLDQVLPAGLRDRVSAVAETTVHLSRRAIPAVSTDALMQLATACRRLERLRFDYTDAQDRPSVRHTEPYRVVCSDWQWYLVAYDVDREGWRTFRIDRMSQLVSTGATFAPREDTPDAAAQVSAGLALYSWELQATVRLHTTLERARHMIDHDEGVLEPDGDTVLLRTGGEMEWLAPFVAGLECDFDIIEPEELRHALRAHAEALLRRAERSQATRPSASPAVDTT